MAQRGKNNVAGFLALHHQTIRAHRDLQGSMHMDSPLDALCHCE